MPIPLVYNPAYSFGFPEKHRFPMQKFRLLHDYLLKNNIVQRSNVFRPGRCKTELLEHTHCEQYINDFCTNKLDTRAQRRMGLPWSEDLKNRTLIAPNGTLLAASIALKYGIACHLAGGTHHAHYDFGSGFCVFNDLVVAAKTVIARGDAKRVLIFDCDVHQGDGTASLCTGIDNIFTCSIHCEKNFPYRKVASDIDIGLEKHTNDHAYLNSIKNALTESIKKANPDLILYDAGVDIFTKDPLGLLNISENGIRERDFLILSQAKQQNIPIATVIGGGYDTDELALAKRHAIVIESAHDIFNG